MTANPTPDAYPVQSAVDTRPEHMNVASHVSAMVLAMMLEDARMAMMADDLGFDLTPGGDRFGIVQLDMNFRREVIHPATLRIGSGITAVGTTSFKIAQALFVEGACACTSLATYVNLGETGSKPIADRHRDAMARIMCG